MLKYVFAAILILLLFLIKILNNKLSQDNRFILKTVLIVLLLEVTIFNINSYRTDFGNLKYKQFSSEELTFKISSTKDNSQYLSLQDLNMKVKSIYIRLGNLEEEQVVDYDIYYADEI